MFVFRTLHRMLPNNASIQTLRYKKNFAKNKMIEDAGIRKRKMFAGNLEELEQLQDHDFDLEADFMNVATTHKEYEQEQMHLKEKQKHWIVKQKYFKQHFPNFLTWSDKEQIRYLHRKDPDEWTNEKLSEGFPALPEVIAKILKSTWTQKSDQKIKNHDESVKQNWASFKEGKLEDLPPNLVQHLSKFTNRDLDYKSFKLPLEFKPKTNESMIAPNIKVGSEFADIIKSYERLKHKHTRRKEEIAPNTWTTRKPPNTDTYLLEKTKFSKHVTLNQLQKQVEQKAVKSNISEDEKIMLTILRDEKEEKVQPVECSDNIDDLVSQTKYASTPLSKSVKGSDQKQDVEYPNEIIIPKDKYKKGYTYKLNDCYYDDDGEFLYRVPGMYK